jgi:ribosomal protein L32
MASQLGGCPVFQYREDHHACPVCGFYDGKQAVAVKQKPEPVE